MDALNELLAETGGQADTTTSKTIAKKPESDDSVQKHLLIAGSDDWENMTSKLPSGLEGPHKVALPKGCEPLKTFSSGMSMHFFILCKNGKLFGVGRYGGSDYQSCPNKLMISLPLRESS